MVCGDYRVHTRLCIKTDELMAVSLSHLETDSCIDSTMLTNNRVTRSNVGRSSL